MNGLRAVVSKNLAVLKGMVEAEKPDLLCLQETKLQEGDERAVSDCMSMLFPKYIFFWNDYNTAI